MANKFCKNKYRIWEDNNFIQWFGNDILCTIVYNYNITFFCNNMRVPCNQSVHLASSNMG